MSQTDTKSLKFSIGGALPVNRLGYGAMRIVGPGIWEQPADRSEVLRTLRALPGLGVDFIDTADSYGPNISEDLIREALHPYPDMVIATKAGLVRTGPDQWTALGRPEYLIQQAHASRMRLGLDQIPLWQLHRIDPKVPRDEQFGAIRRLLSDGVIARAGLSEVTVEEIEAASRVFTVSTVQNRYNLTDRSSEDVLTHCEQHGIGFIPWFPLGAGDLVKGRDTLDGIAGNHDASAGQIAIAWLLARSPVILPIPGTSKLDHLQENVAARDIELSAEEMSLLNRMA